MLQSLLQKVYLGAGKNKILGSCTARNMLTSTRREPYVSIGSPPGTAWSVLNVRAFSTGRADQY